LIPEPILENLGREYGSKFATMQRPSIQDRIPRIIETIEAGERGDTAKLRRTLEADAPSLRYWAAVWLGNLHDEASQANLEALADDPVPTVRVAAHLALCKLGHTETHLPKLADLIDEPNLVVGMYAMNAIEQTGVLNQTVRSAAQEALANPYEFTQRYGRRLLALCDAQGST
jgi:HEAT repeat protein